MNYEVALAAIRGDNHPIPDQAARKVSLVASAGQEEPVLLPFPSSFFSRAVFSSLPSVAGIVCLVKTLSCIFN